MNKFTEKTKKRKYTFNNFIKSVKSLRGDPHYISKGMALGVFVGVTPTFPFHTTLALVLAALFRGSPAAAALGVWFGNPITMPFFYFGSYKAGMMLLGKSLPEFAINQQSLTELIKMGFDVTAAMIAGGMLIGIIPGIAGYFVTHKIVSVIHRRKKSSENILHVTTKCEQ